MKRNIKLLSLLLVLSCLSACASLVVSRPSGNQNGSRTVNSGDARITNRVNSAFVHDSSIPAFDINVSTHNGVVTLTGYAPDKRTRDRAGEVASAQEDVKSVRNYIRLK